MASRTFEDIEHDFATGVASRNARLLNDVSVELRQFDTDVAHALAYRARSFSNLLEGHYGEAKEDLELALSLYQKIGDKKGMASCMNGIGIIHEDLGNYSACLEHLHKALALYEEITDVGGMGAVTSNIGNAFNATGDLPAAMEYWNRALALHEQAGNRQNIANTTSNLGALFASTGDRQRGIEFIERAFQIHMELENFGYAAGACAEIGSFLAAEGDPEGANEWMERGFHLLERVTDVSSRASVLIHFMQFLQDQGQLDDVEELLRTQGHVLDHSPTTITSKMLIEGKLAVHRSEFERARTLFSEALSQSTSRNERQGMAEIHKLLRDLAKNMGDFDGYIQHNEEFLRLSEEVSGATSARRMVMQEKEREIEDERKQRDREREILYGALPQHVAERLVRGEEVTDSFASASVMFLDLAGFTRIASTIPPGHVVHLLESIFSVCDEIILKHGVTKVKTIGDSYMAVAGVPDIQADHVDRMARAATEIQRALTDLQLKMPPELGDTSWVNTIPEVHARVGIHCGPVVAGVVGKERLQYDVWGDAVNVASRMESSGEPGRVQASQEFIDALSERSSWQIDPRIAFEIKGKGMMQTYWLDQRR